MTTWSFYRESDGAIVDRKYRGPLDLLAANTPEGCIAIEGAFDHRLHRFDLEACLVVDWRAPEPEPGCIWSDVLVRWMPPAERAASARADRNARIAACDWTQVADVPLSDEQRAAWQAYRQALRDVTEQPGFPDSIDWPAPPA